MLVEKFFGFWELEKALIVVAWIDIVFGTVTLAIFALVFAFFMIEDCEKIKEALENLHIDDCSAFKTGVSVAMILFTFFVILIIVVNYLLIRGAKTRNHKLLLPGLIINAITVPIVSISYILTLNPTFVVSGVFVLIFGTYLFLCLYSLYVRFRNEKTNFDNVQYQPA